MLPQEPHSTENCTPVVSTLRESGPFAAYLASATNAADPRDKIYTALGLADPDTTSRLITVDYHIPPTELFINFTRRYLQQYNDPRILAHSVGCGEQGPTPMPSWTFRPTSESWHTLRNGLYAWDYDGAYSLLERPRFQCSGSSSCSPAFEDDGRRLGLSGYQIDTITSTAVMEPSQSIRGPGLDTLEVRHAITYLRWRATAAADKRSLYRDSAESTSDVLRSIIYSTYVHLSKNDRDAVVRCEAFLQERLGAIARIPLAPNHLASLCGSIMCGLLHWSREAGLLDYDLVNMPTFMQCMNRRLIKTSSGYLGLASRHADARDAMALLAGSQAPFVLRKTGKYYKVVGDCYVHGTMDGELWDEGKCDRLWIE